MCPGGGAVEAHGAARLATYPVEQRCRGVITLRMEAGEIRDPAPGIVVGCDATMHRLALRRNQHFVTGLAVHVAILPLELHGTFAHADSQRLRIGPQLELRADVPDLA